MKDLLEQLRNIDPNDPGRWPLGIRLGTIVLVFVVGTIGAVYYMAWSSKQPELEAAQQQEQTLLEELKGKAAKAANLDAYKAQLKEMEQSFGSMLRQLPNKTEIPSLLVDISQKGLEAGLEQKLFQPGSEVKHGFYAELPIKIEMTGNFHSIGTFVSGIAALPRIVTLHDISINSKSAASDNLDFQVTAKTYRYLEENELSGSKKGAKKK